MPATLLLSSEKQFHEELVVLYAINPHLTFEASALFKTELLVEG